MEVSSGFASRYEDQLVNLTRCHEPALAVLPILMEEREREHSRANSSNKAPVGLQGQNHLHNEMDT